MPSPSILMCLLEQTESSILLWFNPRWQPSPMKLTHPPPPDEWEGELEKGKTYGLRWEQINNSNTGKYNNKNIKNTDKKTERNKAQEKQMIHSTTAHHPPGLIPSSDWPLLANSPQFIHWTQCAMVWNIPVARLVSSVLPMLSHKASPPH